MQVFGLAYMLQLSLSVSLFALELSSLMVFSISLQTHVLY